MNERANQLSQMTPNLVADIRLYAKDEGGLDHTIFLGWGCPCCPYDAHPVSGYDAWPLLGDAVLKAGDSGQFGFVFFSEEGARIIRDKGDFYLWEGRFIGVARVVRDASH